MPKFDLSNYVDVAERIEQFYKDHEDGRITTDLINVGSDVPQSQFIVFASAWLGDTLKATGLAEESFGPSGPNQTSALENAETSAIGRALANMGYQTTRDGKRQRPSRQEMEKVGRGDVTAIGNLINLLMESGLPKAAQGDIISAELGFRVTKLESLTDEQIAAATRAIEGAIADLGQEEKF